MLLRTAWNYLAHSFSVTFEFLQRALLSWKMENPCGRQYTFPHSWDDALVFHPMCLGWSSGDSWDQIPSVSADEIFPASAQLPSSPQAF